MRKKPKDKLLAALSNGVSGKIEGKKPEQPIRYCQSQQKENYLDHCSAGTKSLLSVTTPGARNVFIGYNALQSMHPRWDNVAIGSKAGHAIDGLVGE